MSEFVKHVSFAESVLPPVPWTVADNQILAGDMVVATVSCRNAEAVARQIADTMNRVVEVEALHHEMRILRREIEALEDRKYEE